MLTDIKISNRCKFHAIKNQGFLPKESICKGGDNLHNFKFNFENKRYSKQVCKNCGMVKIFTKPINAMTYNNFKFRDLVQSRQRTKHLFEYIYGRQKLKYNARTNQRSADNRYKDENKEIEQRETIEEAKKIVNKQYI
jgi:predicted nucleic-acid-binding Zn-ribbon protein